MSERNINNFSINTHAQLVSEPLTKLVRTDIGVAVDDFSAKHDAFEVAKRRSDDRKTIFIAPQGKMTFCYHKEQDDWWIRPEDRFWDGALGSDISEVCKDQRDIVSFSINDKDYLLHTNSKALDGGELVGLTKNVVSFSHYQEARKGVVAESLRERLLDYLPRLDLVLLPGKVDAKRGNNLLMARVHDRFVVMPEGRKRLIIDDLSGKYEERFKGRHRYLVAELDGEVYELHESRKSLPHIPSWAAMGIASSHEYFSNIPKSKRNGYSFLDVAPPKFMTRYSMQASNINDAIR